MLDFLAKHGRNVHSQNMEDGLTQECVRRLGLTTGHCVEIGGHDGHWMSNTRLLIENGWSATFVETDYRLWEQCRDNWADSPKVKCICSHADKYNINAFVKDDCDLLSLDTDGTDYRLFEAVKAKPKIVIVEIDSSIPPGDRRLNADGAPGYTPMLELGIEKGYFLLCHSGNMILVRNKYRELFPEIVGDGIENSELYFNRGWLKEAA